MKKVRMRKILVTMLTVILVLGCFCGVAEAKTKQKTVVVFKDVTTKTTYYKDVKYLYEKGAYKGIAKKGGKFKPTQNMTQKEFIKTLRNLYGSKINLANPKKSSTKLTQKTATDTLFKVSEQLGYRVRWSGGSKKAKVTRAKAAYYVHLMIKTADGALDP